MTTTVTVSIKGNKAVKVQVSGAEHQNAELLPNESRDFFIHGEQTVSAVETGEFL